MKTEEQIKYANRGVPRNKRPLKNVCYKIELAYAKDESRKEELRKYDFKGMGYLTLTWWYESKDPLYFWHGFIEPEVFKELIGEKQWCKFCQGKREFIVQRRIDGKNVKKKKNE